jgi:thymidylate synthase (FAD)
MIPDGAIAVLDQGYVTLVESWGSDERIVEAARMSTDKGFQGWGPVDCSCAGDPPSIDGEVGCKKCSGTTKLPGDEKLLRYLWDHKHATPFEMAGMTIEVQAPIFVFREWHRHRTQSYNELSARYTPLPNMNYRPSRDRIIDGARSTRNKQAAGTAPLAVECVDDWLKALDAAYEGLQQTYETGLAIGIPKELARLPVPVARYSRMRASANLRNWLAFLTLRTDAAAQWEIRQYANAVLQLVETSFPRTFSVAWSDVVESKP